MGCRYRGRLVCDTLVFRFGGGLRFGFGVCGAGGVVSTGAEGAGGGSQACTLVICFF